MTGDDKTVKPAYIHANSRSMVDQDYFLTLSDTERQWLNKFNQEYYMGMFTDKKNKLHKGKKREKEIWRDCYARRADVYSQKNRVYDKSNAEYFNDLDVRSPEESIIDYLDRQRKKKHED